MRTNLTLCLLLFAALTAVSQPKKRTFPKNINASNRNVYYPAVSGDGISMLFMSDFTDSGQPAINYSSKKDGVNWDDPIELPRTMNQNHLLFEGGYSLNFDGTVAYLTMERSGGLGGYDIWYSKFSGGAWQAPINYGNKLNSSANEGMPSVSSSGQSLYFCKCETMKAKVATGCEIYVATKRGKVWEDAQKLPQNINSYQPQSPKIMADGETLIFSSKQGGSADLYLTRKKEDGSWSNPVPMSFVNSTEDEQFVSFDVKGRYLFHDIKTEKGRELEEILIPDEFKGKNVMHILGTIAKANSNEGIAAVLKVYETNTRERIVFEELNENESFNFAIKEGGIYDFSVEPADDSYAYFSKLYDLTEMRNSPRDELTIAISPFKSGTEVTLGGLAFEEGKSEIIEGSTYELRRLTRQLKSNAASNFELKIHRYNYLEDGTQSSSDLTEVIIDTIATQIEKTIQVTDTIRIAVSDTLNVMDSTATSDSNELFEEKIETRDSVIMVPSYEYNYTYHNDRTEKQINIVIAYLVENGIGVEKIRTITTKTEDAPPRGVPDIVVTLKKL